MKSILLVDDDALLRESVREHLTLAGYSVAEAEGADDAVGLLSRNHFDLMITDVVMPGMNGNDLVNGVRRSFPDLPILAISGGSRTMNARVGLESTRRSGADDILPKPFTRMALLCKVAALLPEVQP